jgi:hypothetical protein
MSLKEDKEFRALMAVFAMQGLLAGELEGRYSPVYLGPDGKETYSKKCFPLKENGEPDFSQPERDNPMVRTTEQTIARYAVMQADALIAELEKENKV